MIVFVIEKTSFMLLGMCIIIKQDGYIFHVNKTTLTYSLRLTTYQFEFDQLAHAIESKKKAALDKADTYINQLLLTHKT